MRIIALTLSLLSLLAAGCGDTDLFSGLPEGFLPDTEEAVALLTVDLPAAFDDLDADAYGALLHPDYRYLFMGDEAPEEYPAGFWGRTSEIAVMEAIFSDTAVTGAVLQISIYDEDAVALARVPGTDAEWAWTTTTTITEAAFMTAANDTAGAASYYAFTKMAYELRIDLAGEGSWRIYEQTELPPIFGGGPGKAGWGAVKTLYYIPLAVPETRTVKGEVSVDGGAGAAGITVAVGADTVLTDLFGRFEIVGVDGGETAVTLEGTGLLPLTVPIGGGDPVYRISPDLEPAP